MNTVESMLCEEIIRLRRQLEQAEERAFRDFRTIQALSRLCEGMAAADLAYQGRLQTPTTEEKHHV